MPPRAASRARRRHSLGPARLLWAVLAVLLSAATAAVARAGPTGAEPAAAPGAVAAVTVPGKVAVVRDDVILVVDEEGERVLFAPPPGGLVRGPVWSPDGRALAFAYAPPRPRGLGPPASPDDLFVSDVMVVDADGAHPRLAVPHDAPGAILESPAWSPDGHALYFGYFRPRADGARTADQTVELRRHDLASGAGAAVAADATMPAPSPDGRRLAFVAEGPRVGPALRILDPASGPHRDLVPAGRFTNLMAPRVSPDGATVAFSAPAVPGDAGTPPSLTAQGREAVWEVWTVPVAGGEPRQLTRIGEALPTAAWSRDGARLLVQGDRGRYLVEVGTGATVRVSADGGRGGLDWWSEPEEA